jgi:putative iron-dependent peroxidase
MAHCRNAFRAIFWLAIVVGIRGAARMSRPQSAICPATGAFGIFITCTMVHDAGAALRLALAGFPALSAAIASDLGQPHLVSAVAVGCSVWEAVFGLPRPVGLVPFVAVADGPRKAPSTPGDLFLHIHSPSHDANFVLARALIARLSGLVTLVEEIHAFRHMEGRDLTGFVDGTENPQGDERGAVALVGGADPHFAGGSHVSIQRYVHDMARWATQIPKAQEAIIGRTKDTDEELDAHVKPPTAHIARVVIEEDGHELEILRHGLPYGTTSECGLYFIAYCKSAAPFRRMLENMIKTDAQGHHDRLLDFTRAVTGASFFAPSIGFLERFK